MLLVAPAGTLTGTTLASNVVSSSLTSVGTIASGTWNGSTIGTAYGGTGTNSTFTTGSVVFADGSGIYSQNNSDFFWDNTNLALGVGTIPSTTLAVIDAVNNSGSAKAIQETGYGSSVGFRGRYAAGVLASPSPVPSGTTIAFLSGRGYGTTGFASASTGQIDIQASQTFTDSTMGTRLLFSTTPNGSTSLAERMRIANTGDVLIGTTTDDGTDILQLNGSLFVATGTPLTTTRTNLGIDAGSSYVTSGVTYTTPSSITTSTLFRFIIIGGGGAGGGNPAAANNHGSGGGGACTILLDITGLSPSTGYTVAIGAGGTGVSGSTGNNGGNTTLTIGSTTYTAGGGSGGLASGQSSGGAGGTCTNGTVQIAGQAGADDPTNANTSTSGMGGSSGLGWGLGGAGLHSLGTTGGPGQNATGYGGGGSGSTAGSTGGAQAGGNGSQGIIAVTYWN